MARHHWNIDHLHSQHNHSWLQAILLLRGGGGGEEEEEEGRRGEEGEGEGRTIL